MAAVSTVIDRTRRRLPRIMIVLFAVLALALMTEGTASAHKPLFKNGNISSPARAMTIPNPNISWAIYASLDTPHEADYYVFHAKSGLLLNAQITIPAIPSLKQFAPHLALLGPGLPSPQANTVPFSIPSGDGVQIMNATHAGATDVFNEPFTQTVYWDRQTLKETLSTAGTYYLVVFNLPADALQTGKYVLAVGNVEQFGPSDLLSFPLTYFHVRFFTGAGMPAWAWIALAVIVLLVLLLCYRIAKRRRNKRAKAEIRAKEPASVK